MLTWSLSGCSDLRCCGVSAEARLSFWLSPPAAYPSEHQWYCQGMLNVPRLATRFGMRMECAWIANRVQGQRWGLLLSGMCELVAKGTGKPEVLVSLVPRSSLMRFHRPLFLMKEFKKDIEPHQGTRTMPGNTWENLTCASQWDKTGCIQDCWESWFMSVQSRCLWIVMEIGKVPQFLAKAKCCTCLQERSKVNSRLLSLSSLCGGSPLGANLCIDVGSEWEPMSWTALEENHLPCENSQEME